MEDVAPNTGLRRSLNAFIGLAVLMFAIVTLSINKEREEARLNQLSLMYTSHAAFKNRLAVSVGLENILVDAFFQTTSSLNSLYAITEEEFCLPRPPKPCLDTKGLIDAKRYLDKYLSDPNAEIAFSVFKTPKMVSGIDVAYIRALNSKYTSLSPLVDQTLPIHIQVFNGFHHFPAALGYAIIENNDTFKVGVPRNVDSFRFERNKCVRLSCLLVEFERELVNNISYVQFMGDELPHKIEYAFYSDVEIFQIMRDEIGIVDANNEDEVTSKFNEKFSERDEIKIGPIAISVDMAFYAVCVMFTFLLFSLNYYANRYPLRGPIIKGWIVGDHRGFIEFVFASIVFFSPVLVFILISIKALNISSGWVQIFGYQVKVDFIKGIYDFNYTGGSSFPSLEFGKQLEIAVYDWRAIALSGVMIGFIFLIARPLWLLRVIFLQRATVPVKYPSLRSRRRS